MAILPVVWKPDPKDPRRLFVDLSRHNGRVNMARLKAYAPPTVDAIYMRAGIGKDYIDSQLLYFYELAAELEWPVALYQVWHPAYNTDEHIRLLDRLYRLVRPIKEPDGPPIIDLELSGNITRQKYADRVSGWINKAVNVCGRKGAGYTRVSWLLANMASGAWMQTVDWIFAQYTWSGREHPGPYTMHPMIPRARVVAIQTSKRGDGLAMGTESKAIDLDRWLQGETAWEKFWHGS